MTTSKIRIQLVIKQLLEATIHAIINDVIERIKIIRTVIVTKASHKSFECTFKTNPTDGKYKRDLAMSTTINEVMGNKDTGWYLDSGYISHLCNDSDNILCKSTFHSDKLNLANKRDPIKIDAKGNVRSKVFDQDNNIRKVNLSNVLYVPELNVSLISVVKARKKGIKDIVYQD